MEYRKFGQHYVVRIDKGEEVLSKITELCDTEHIRLGQVVGLGASDYAVVGYFDTAKKVYVKKELRGQMEISSLVGNISTKEGETYLHFHINLSDEDMHIHGGHLNECRISATCEITVTELDGRVEREMNEEIGLNLYKFS